MPICQPRSCGCQYTSETLSIFPDESNANLIHFEVADPSVITGIQDDITDINADIVDINTRLSGAAIAWLNQPAGNTDATTSTTAATWLTTAITVPAWATAAIVTANVTNVTCITAACIYALDVAISGNGYTQDIAAANFGAAAAIVDAIPMTKRVTGFSTGSVNVLVGARRVSGTGTMRAISTSKISGSIHFMP